MFQRFGIRARLLLAFCGICTFAVLAGVVALYSFIEVGKVLSRISLIDAPEAIHSLELSRQAERMLSTASEMQTITTLSKHVRIRGKIDTESKRLEQILLRLKGDRQQDDFVILEIDTTVKQLRGNLDELNDLVVHRLRLQLARKKLIREFNNAYVEIQQLLSTAVAELEKMVSISAIHSE